MANSGVFRINTGSNKTTETDIFFKVAGISDPTHIIAINVLVHLLKINKLWEKFTAIYPFVGGNDNSHKYNLKKVDKHIIEWGEAGSYGHDIKHDWYGVQPGERKNLLNLNLSDIPNYDTSFSCIMYVRNHHVADITDIGENIGSIGSRVRIHLAYYSHGGITHYDFGDDTGNVRGLIPDTTGCLAFNTLSNVSTIYRNGISTNISGSIPYVSFDMPLYFNAGNWDGYVLFNPRQYSFLAFGNAFTSVEHKKLNEIIQIFQGILNRAV